MPCREAVAPPHEGLCDAAASPPLKRSTPEPSQRGCLPCTMRSAQFLVEVLDMVLEWLPLSGVASVLLLSRGARTVSDSVAAWRRYCAALWDGKAYVSPACRGLLAAGDARAAVRVSLADLHREWITEEELCGVIWYCRTKRSAGKTWTRNDPWWRGRSAYRRRFATSGEVLEPGEVEGSWEVSTVGSFPVRWRFATWIPVWDETIAQPVARPVQPGSRVKFLDLPTALVWRHPLNWGFVLDSPWSVMTSFEIPRRGASSSADMVQRELALSLQDPRLRNNPLEAALEVDFFRSGIRVPDKQPAPENFFARELGFLTGLNPADVPSRTVGVPDADV
eukprot:CAMPEP_0179084958 /NCGR_PEP_ID=MMETSP0796-20121207/38448_1 /TAXON_ID=73915 /ORGANISM="Pyrodinium bahamense, Strain pbaha01" /LENGTH=335 /DNA_ID=CAMNT_0020782385 /DNA_START=89 /DNA_END=1096 /DNA_ORIENTATION=-